MKIVFFYYSLETGGAERVITSLANRFVEDGFDVTIIILKDAKITYKINEKIRIVSSKATTISSNKIKWFKYMRNEFRKINPDIVISFSIELTLLAKISTLCTGIRVIGSERSGTKYSAVSLKKKIFILMVSIFCDGYIFLTKRGMLAYPQIIQRKATVIPNAVFVTPNCNSLNLNLNKDTKKYKILSIGRLNKGKDFATLIQAFAKFHKLYSKYELDIYGEGPELDNLKELINDLNMHSEIHLKGHCKDVSTIMKYYDLFVFTSKSEGMPNALIEALAFGMPAISTDCDFGPSELITNGYNGVLVPVGDVNKIRDAMVTIAENHSFARMLSNNAKQINATHSEVNIHQSYRDYIQKVTDKYKKDKLKC